VGLQRAPHTGILNVAPSVSCFTLPYHHRISCSSPMRIIHSGQVVPLQIHLLIFVENQLPQYHSRSPSSASAQVNPYGSGFDIASRAFLVLGCTARDCESGVHGLTSWSRRQNLSFRLTAKSSIPSNKSDNPFLSRAGLVVGNSLG
jgi:hypothetical protein